MPVKIITPLPPYLEELREIYLGIVTLLEAGGSGGVNAVRIKEVLGIDQSRVEDVMKMAMALHLVVGYGHTVGRRYVLTQLGKLVAVALQEGKKPAESVDLEKLESACENLLKTYRR